MHHKILSEEFFAEFYFGSSEYSFDSDDVTLRFKKKDKKLSVIDSDRESKSEAHGARECSLASTEQWTADNISQKLEDLTGMSGVTTECNSPRNVSKITKLIFIQPK